MDNIILSIYKNPTNDKKDTQKIIKDDSTALQYREKRKHNRNKKKFVKDFSKTNDNIGEKVCVKKVMQVAKTVYEEKLLCHHKLSEKCHRTFVTEYTPNMEKKCETSYQKRCSINYNPVMHSESIRVCHHPLVKQCSDNAQGEEVCNTFYEAICSTRYKETLVEEDRPVCKVVNEKKCDFEKCTDWPRKQCIVEKAVTTKTKPETSCSKMPRTICAPSTCKVITAEEKCQEEPQNYVINIPSESCELEPEEVCRMETVLVPKLVERPRCIQVPQEV